MSDKGFAASKLDWILAGGLVLLFLLTRRTGSATAPRILETVSPPSPGADLPISEPDATTIAAGSHAAEPLPICD